MADTATAPAPVMDAPVGAPPVSMPADANAAPPSAAPVPDATPDDMVALLNNDDLHAAPYGDRIAAVNQIGQGIVQHLQQHPDGSTPEDFAQLMAAAYEKVSPPAPQGVLGSFWAPIQENGPAAVAGTAAGWGAATVAAPSAPVTFGAGPVMADIAASTAASYAVQKGRDWARGPKDTREAQEQGEVNTSEHPWASAMGASIPFMTSMLNPVNWFKKAATTTAGKIGQRVVSSSIAGARAGGISAAQKYANGSANLMDIPKEMAQSAATMAPLGFLGPAKNILTAMGVKAPAEAAIAATSDAIYRRLVHGEPLDLSHITQGAVSDVPGFILLNAMGSVFHQKAKINQAASASTSSSISKLVSAPQRFLQIWLGGRTLPKTTAADRVSGELGGRWISSKAASTLAADTFSEEVLKGSGIDPERFGAALSEDNLRSIRDGFVNEANQLAAQGKYGESVQKHSEAANVTTLIGAAGSPFQNEAQYQHFLQEPAVRDAIDRHKQLWQSTIDPMYRNAAQIDPATPLPPRGAQTGARINLFNDKQAKGTTLTGNASGNPTNTFRKKTVFHRQARGTGQSYTINYAEIMRNTFAKQLEIGNKNAFEKQLVASGNAIEGPPALPPVLSNGEATRAFPLGRTVMVKQGGGAFPLARNLYVRESLANEYERAADMEHRGEGPALMNLLNQTALAGLTDGTVHITNLLTALLTRPGASAGALSDTLLSALARADIPVTIFKLIQKCFQDTQMQTAQLAEIGAMKSQAPLESWNPVARWMGSFIQGADRNVRLVLDDMFQRLAKQGLVQNTETNRREFVNQVGQYNIRAQGTWRRLARQTGLGPFVTAGTTFNTLGLRTLALRSGAQATSPYAAALLSANVLSKWIGAATIAGTLNYLFTKDKGGGVYGRPGVPLGRIDTGLNDANGNPLSFPFFDVIGLGRGLRVTGIRGFVEAQRKGLNLQNSVDSAARDLVNSNTSPFFGPVVRFGSIAASGQMPAINVPREAPVVAPGESQVGENFKTALVDANPILKSAVLSQQPGQGYLSALQAQLPRFALSPSQPPAMMADYPSIVRRAQAGAFIDDVIARARKMSLADRTAFINESLNRLDPADRQHAMRTLKERKIFTR